MEIYYTLGIVFIIFGLLTIITTTIVARYKPAPLNSKDFSLQVFTPTILALVLYGIGISLYLWQMQKENGLDESLMAILTIITACGGIVIGFFTMFNSLLKMLYTSD